MLTVKVTPRQLWNLICAQNAQTVSLGSGDWNAFLVATHMKADGIEPLTYDESKRLLRRLERYMPKTVGVNGS